MIFCCWWKDTDSAFQELVEATTYLCIQKYMKDYHINIFYSEEDDGYIEDIPDLVHCSAFGETPEKALLEALEAKKAWLEAAHAEGKTIPPPRYRPAIYHLTSSIRIFQ